MKEVVLMAEEDVAACKRLGRFGADLIEDGDTVITQCNAGALATVGYGTALGRDPGSQRAGEVRQGHRPGDEACPPGLEAHGLRALEGRVQLHDNLRHRRRVDDAVRAGSTWPSSGRTGSRRTASSSTRSGRTR